MCIGVLEDFVVLGSVQFQNPTIKKFLIKMKEKP